MADPIIGLTVNVTHDATTLNLNDHVNYDIVKWWPPLVSAHRKTTVDSDYVPGEVLVASVPAAQELRFIIRVKASGWVAHDAAARTFAAALQQFQYAITEIRAGVTRVWTGCQPATITPRENEDTSHPAYASQIERGIAEYVVAIRCDPPSLEAP